jgi:serine protease Do
MRTVLGVLFAVALAGASLAQPTTDRSVGLTRVGTKLDDYAVVGVARRVESGAHTLHWTHVAENFTGLEAVFQEEVKAAGFRPDQEPGDLFADADSSSPDIEVGALIEGVTVNIYGSGASYSGQITLKVEWQLYSNTNRQVVAKITTQQSLTQGMGQVGAQRSLYQDAFAACARQLLASAEFRRVLRPDPWQVVEVRKEIRLIGPPAGTTSIAEATNSVVTVFAGGGLGSGVLVSSDGYLLTNQHVVGAAKRVRVRWSDGRETTGEVLRVNRERDVALIKTDPGGRPALALRRASPAPGSTVFAKRTPFDAGHQNTVTRGVVSANRIIKGMSYIQSDVAVTTGNSGGPLLDEGGRVVGLTQWGFRPDGESASLNFFIPIGDALNALAVRPTS